VARGKDARVGIERFGGGRQEYCARFCRAFKQIVSLLKPPVSTWFVSHFVSRFPRRCIGLMLNTLKPPQDDWEKEWGENSRRNMPPDLSGVREVTSKRKRSVPLSNFKIANVGKTFWFSLVPAIAPGILRGSKQCGWFCTSSLDCHVSTCQAKRNGKSPPTVWKNLQKLVFRAAGRNSLWS